MRVLLVEDDTSIGETIVERDEWGRRLESVARSVQRLQRLVAQLLDLARRQDGVAGPIVLVDAREILAGVIADVVPIADTCGDTGPGMPEPDLARAFERFRRGADDAGIEGTGLGLSICREIASRLGGEVRLENRTTGGSRFDVLEDCNGLGLVDPSGKLTRRRLHAAVIDADVQPQPPDTGIGRRLNGRVGQRTLVVSLYRLGDCQCEDRGTREGSHGCLRNERFPDCYRTVPSALSSMGSMASMASSHSAQ